MPSIEELLAGAGEVLGEGGFTLDREQARKKLRQFQLPDPRRYVLLLVQVGVHLGASRIDFEIDADDVRVRFDGDPLLAVELEALDRSLFVPGSDARGRARRELALALNAAMALHPRFVRVRSLVADRGAFLELRPDEADAFGPIERGSDEPGDGPLTTIHVRDRFRPGLLVEFVRDLRGQIAEERILREHCRWSPIPVFIEGEPIAATLALGDACLVRVAIDQHGITGEAGFVDDGELDPRADVLGMFAAAIPLPGFSAGFRALVDAPRLRTDLSRNDIVHDAAYHELLDVLEHAAERALAELATEPVREPAWVADMLRSTLVRRGPIELLMLDGSPATTRLAALPLWPTSERWRTTNELHRWSDEIEYVTRDARRLPPGYGDVVLAGDDAIREQLLALFGQRAVDRTAAFDAAIDRLSRQDAFLGRAFPRVLGPGRYVGRWWIKTETFTGEVGLRPGTDDPAIRIVVGGRLLESRRLAHRMLPLHGLVAVVEGPFRPSPNWDHAERDDVLADALLEIVRGAHGIVRQEAERIGTAAIDPELARTLLPYLAAVARGTVERTFFAAMGVPDAAMRAHLQRTAHAPLGIDPASALGSLRLFATVDGRMVSLRDLEGGGPVHVVADACEPMLDPPHLVLRLSADGLRIVEAAYSVIRFDAGYEQIRRERRWGRRDPDHFRLRRRSCVDAIELAEAGTRLLVGVVALARIEPGPTGELVVQKRGRDLCVLEIDSPLPHAVGTIDGDIAVDRAYAGPRDDGVRAELVAAFMRGIAALVDRIAGRVFAGTEPSDAERRVLLGAAAIPFAGRWAWVDAHRRQRADKGVHAANAWLRERTADADHPELRQRVLEHLPTLETIVLRTTDGTLALGQVLDEVAAHGELRWVAATAAATASDRPVLVLDPGERELLARLVGAPRLSGDDVSTEDPAVPLLEAVRAQLRTLRARGADRFDDAHLDVLELRPHDSSALAFVDADHVVLNEHHPVARRALRNPDPILVALAASAVHTALRTHLPELADDPELTRLHADLLAR